MYRANFTTLFIIMVSFLFTIPAFAQVGGLQKYEFRAGFYGGPSQYIGPYNTWWFGSPYEYGDDLETENYALSGELNYGAHLSIRLRPRMFIRINAEFGNLRYADENLNYTMSTPYASTSLNVEFKGNPDGRLRPYMVIGFGTLNFQSPPPNEHPDFSEHSPNQLGDNISANVIPLTFGMQYNITDRTALFSEAAFHLSTTNELDNFTPPDPDFSLPNDAFLSLRFGISMEILRRSNLPLRQAPVADAMITPVSEYYPELRIDDPELYQPAPVDSLIEQRRREQEAIAMAEQERLEEERRREEEAVVVPEPEPERPVIRVVEPEESQFEPEEALEELEQLMEERRARAELGEIDLSDWDPEVPIIVTTPRPIPGTLVDETGIVTENPPQGYYVQVYASVGPISATNARDMTINALSDILEDPERQVIITMRQQFYEVRIGVFDSYDDTIAVLREIQGTFVDSYSLIYVPRD